MPKSPTANKQTNKQKRDSCVTSFNEPEIKPDLTSQVMYER